MCFRQCSDLVAAGGGQWQRRRGVPFDSMADVEELNRLVAQLTVSLRQQNEARERPTAQSDEENGSDENDLERGESDSGSYKSHVSVGSESLSSERDDLDDLPVHSLWDVHDHDEIALQDCGNLAEKRRYGEIVLKNKELCWPFFVKHLECLWTKQTWPLTELITEETLQKILLKHFLEPEEDVTLEEGSRVIAVPDPRRRSYILQGIIHGTMYQMEAKGLAYGGVVVAKGFDEEGQMDRVHIRFDLICEDEVPVCSPFLKVLNSVCSVHAPPASMEPCGKFFGIRLQKPAEPDARVIGKCVRTSRIDEIPTFILAVPLDGVASDELMDFQDYPPDGEWLRTFHPHLAERLRSSAQSYRRRWCRRNKIGGCTGQKRSHIGKFQSAGYLEGDFLFTCLRDWTEVCVPTRCVAEEEILQVGFRARYMNEDVNEAIWPRLEGLQTFPCALDFILVEIAEEDLATDVAGWPKGLHFPRGDDPEVEWSVQRGRLKEEFSADAEALSTKMELLVLKADLDDAIVTWRCICDQGLPQASLGPTLRKLEAEKLFTMLAKHCRSNKRWHTVSGTTIFDERLGRGRSVAEEGHVLVNSSESNFREWERVANSEWCPPWYYPNDAFSVLTRKCAEREMRIEIYHHEHAHQQWTSAIVVQKTELDPDCEM